MTKKQKSKVLSKINLVVKDALDQITEILQDNSLIYDCTINDEPYYKEHPTFEKDLKIHKKIDAKYIIPTKINMEDGLKSLLNDNLLQ